LLCEPQQRKQASDISAAVVDEFTPPPYAVQIEGQLNRAPPLISTKDARQSCYAIPHEV
jgi:hypothetical protein